MNSKRPFRVYGLTGSIASGKSTVAEFFSELGVPVIDADQIARDLRAPGGDAEAPILARFGTIDRSQLREKIARDPKAKADLEAILHPLILRESARRFAALAAAVPTGYALYEAALLVEAGRAKDFEGVILVESEEEEQLRRLMKRDGMNEVDARQFLGTNAKLELKREASTHIIVNSGSREDLRAKVRALHFELL